MNIVLIGYRGTGKSHVADLLAELLHRSVFHMDQEIVALAGMDVSHIVSHYGWEHFRDLESKAVLTASKRDQLIIDTGGGVIVRDSNVQNLRVNGITFWLKARPQTIAERIKDDTERPSLTGGKSFLEEIEEVLDNRTPRYQAAADYEIDTDSLSPEEVVARIVQFVSSERLEACLRPEDRFA